MLSSTPGNSSPILRTVSKSTVFLGMVSPDAGLYDPDYSSGTKTLSSWASLKSPKPDTSLLGYPTRPFIVTRWRKATQKANERMGILETAKPAIIVCTRDRARATAFYRDTLGLALAYEDSFAAVFSVGGVTLRVSVVADFTPYEHTILGFNVPDVAVTVKALREKGVIFNIYQHIRQDGLGIWTAPGGTVRVAWFKDPDGTCSALRTPETKGCKRRSPHYGYALSESSSSFARRWKKYTASL